MPSRAKKCDFVQHQLENPFVNGMNGKLRIVAAALVFTSAAIIFSPRVSATPGNNEPNGTVLPAQCVGVPGAQVVGPFVGYYGCVGLNSVPGVPTPYGGLTFKYDDANTLLIGGGANDFTGRIYQIAVTRDASQHITGFSGTARLYPTSTSRIGQYNDGGVAFGPGNVLLVTRYPGNQLEQSKPGSESPNKVIDLGPLGVTSSVGSLAVVPRIYSTAGTIKLVSFPSGDWYDVALGPDGNGTFNITRTTLRANVGDAEGIAFIPPGAPAFSPNSALIAKYTSNKIITVPLDTQGDPIVAGQQDFISGLNGPEGVAIDPVTGDFLFGTSGADNRIVLVSTFAAAPIPTPTPTPTPSPTPVRCNYRVGIVYAETNEWLYPTALRDEIQADPDVASVGFLNARAGTPTLAQLQQYDIVVAVPATGLADAVAFGDNLATYVDGGGLVVQCAASFTAGTAIGPQGRWLTGNYAPYNYGSSVFAGQFQGSIDDPGHPLMAGVTTLTFTGRQVETLAPGATRVASILPGGDPLVAYRPVSGGHTTIGITAYLTGNHTGDWGKLIVNAGRWLRSCRATPTPTSTPTATPAATPTATPTATATATPTATATSTPVATATVPPLATPTATPTAVPSATPTGTPMPSSHLANISTRMRVEAGDNVLIAGFIIQGNGNKRILIRGTGPSLATFGVADPLQDPTLELNASGGSLVASNDNWPENSNASDIVTSGLAPANSNESALLLSLAPGSYTAVLRGKGGSTGIGLIEVYDLDADGSATVVNISTRGFVLRGENVMIGGLIITGTAPAQLVLRGIGPSLTDVGVPNALADPLLELHDGNGALIQANNDWRESQESALRNTGLAPNNNLESAILISVPPGNYTAVLKGADGGVGNGLVEIYKLAP